MEYINGLDMATLVETCDVEMKKAAGRDGKGAIPDNVWESYSAMANTCGGIILLGMEQLSDHEFRPCHLANAKKMVHDFWCTLNDKGKVSKNILTSQDVALQTLTSGEEIVVIRVRQALRQDKPIFINNQLFGGTYKRLDEGDFLCTDEEVKKMLAEQVSDTMDDGIFVGYGLEDLDMQTFNDYRQRFSNRQPDHPFNKLEPLDFLRMIGGYRQNRQSGEQGLTLAGLLMFGKLRSILDCLPNYIVDYQERPREVSELRWLDRVTTDFNWPGNLFSFYQMVIPKLFAGLKVPFKLEKATERIDDTPVHKAIREAFVNMMIHADLQGKCSLLVVKRPDIFFFRNPGLSRIPKAEMLRGGISDCRNRNLQKMFQLVGLAEQAGSGIPKIFYGWDSQEWKRPDYEEKVATNQTVLTLRMSSLLPDETVADVQQIIGAGNYRALAKLERLALVTAFAEGCVNHERLMSLTTEHAADISHALGRLIHKEYLVSQGHGKATIYYPLGRPPVSDELCYSMPTISNHNGGSSPANDVNSPANDERLPANGVSSPANGERLPDNGGSSPANGGSSPANDERLPDNGGSSTINGGSSTINGVSSHINGMSSHINGGSSHINGVSSHINGGSSHINDVSSHINDVSSHINGGSSPANNGVSSHINGGSSHINEKNTINLKPIPRENVIQNPELLSIAAPVRTKKRVAPNVMNEVIVQLCRGRFLTMAEIAILLNREEITMRNLYLPRLCKEDGPLRRRYPMVNDPRQQYTAKEEKQK